jgi:hypothetical protein
VIYETSRVRTPQDQCQVCGESRKSMESPEAQLVSNRGWNGYLHWCFPCAQIRDSLPWGTSQSDTNAAAQRLAHESKAAASRGESIYRVGWKRAMRVAEFVPHLVYCPYVVYIVIHGDKLVGTQLIVGEGRISLYTQGNQFFTYDEASAKMKEIHSYPTSQTHAECCTLRELLTYRGDELMGQLLRDLDL